MKGTLLLLPLLAACAQPGDPVSYTCADGRTVAARYAGTAATLEIDGKRFELETVVSASGARYLGDGLQWWTKGQRDAWLSMLKPGETIASDAGVACSAR
jgi:membrane-bound inhibitor of C-type lysozyme